MVRMPEDIAVYLGRIDGEFVYYNDWKYKILKYNKEKKEFVLELVGKIKDVA